MQIIRSGMVLMSLVGFVLAAPAETVTRSVPLTTEVVRIFLNGGHELYLTQGEEEYIKLTAPEEMLAQVEARVRGRSLFLGKDTDWNTMGWGSSDRGMRVRFDVQLAHIDGIRIAGSSQVHVGDLNADKLMIVMYGGCNTEIQSIKAWKLKLELSGSGIFQGDSIISQKADIKVNGSGELHIQHMETDELEIDIAGSGDIDFEDLQVSELETEINGSGDLDLVGRAGSQDLQINGSGDYQADKLVSNNAYIDIRGSGDAKISVQNKLTAMITRGANLVYHGNPELEVDINGRGRSRYAGDISRK